MNLVTSINLLKSTQTHGPRGLPPVRWNTLKSPDLSLDAKCVRRWDAKSWITNKTPPLEITAMMVLGMVVYCCFSRNPRHVDPRSRGSKRPNGRRPGTHSGSTMFVQGIWGFCLPDRRIPATLLELEHTHRVIVICLYYVYPGLHDDVVHVVFGGISLVVLTIFAPGSIPVGHGGTQWSMLLAAHRWVGRRGLSKQP